MGVTQIFRLQFDAALIGQDNSIGALGLPLPAELMTSPAMDL